jgi:hypothetical protein
MTVSLRVLSDAETLLFIDVDGVLNVAVQDPGSDPAAFSGENLKLARNLAGQGNPLADRISTVADRSIPADEEEGSYERFVSEPGDLSDLLVGRLARLIQASGSGGSSRIVLASFWRKPQHIERQRFLESRLTAHLGRHFVFDDHTSLREEKGAACRISTIGDYIEGFCQQRAGSYLRKTRVLVLDDFSATALRGLTIDEMPIDSAEGAERYLLNRAGDGSGVSVRVIHTFEEFTAENGMQVSMGCGLRLDYFNQALQFLDKGNMIHHTVVETEEVEDVRYCGILATSCLAVPFFFRFMRSNG